MNAFCSQLKSGFEQTGCNPESGILLAVSGGADSMALLHGTADLFSHQRQGIVVAHLNHALRADEAGADEAFVCRSAEKLGLKSRIQRVPTGEIAQNSEGSLEESARKYRYEFLTRAATELKFSFVATAHHRSDQAETVLHNIIRGSGIRGLTGISSTRQLSPDVQLVRPMLDVSRDAILSFLSQREIEFREDATNSDLNFTRNRIRKQLLPLLRDQFSPQIEDHLATLGGLASDSMRILDEISDDLLQNCLWERQPDVCRLNRTTLQSQSAEVVRQTLTRLWSTQNWSRQQMTRELWQQLASLICSRINRRVDLPGSISLTTDGNLVRVVRESA